MYQNGLEVRKDGSTRDIIGLEFNYKTRSYRDEINHLYKTSRQAKTDYQLAVIDGDNFLINKNKNKRSRLNQLVELAYKNKDQYELRLRDKVRREYYNDGVDVKYISRKKNGEIYNEEIIHYKMLFRSTGKAKKGSCVFIRTELYEVAHNFLYMGITLPDKNAMIVEISAYAPMVASGIVGYAKINPKNILILTVINIV